MVTAPTAPDVVAAGLGDAVLVGVDGDGVGLRTGVGAGVGMTEDSGRATAT
jgi:hypothetical protein